MPKKKSFAISTFLYKNFRRLERFIFLLKSLLTPRQFIYLSCVLVGISSALAVIILKTFAHWVFKSSQKLDDILHLPFSNSTLPIIGIVITAIIVKKVSKRINTFLIDFLDRNRKKPKNEMIMLYDTIADSVTQTDETNTINRHIRINNFLVRVLF